MHKCSCASSKGELSFLQPGSRCPGMWYAIDRSRFRPRPPHKLPQVLTWHLTFLDTKWSGCFQSCLELLGTQVLNQLNLCACPFPNPGKGCTKQGRILCWSSRSTLQDYSPQNSVQGNHDS